PSSSSPGRTSRVSDASRVPSRVTWRRTYSAGSAHAGARRRSGGRGVAAMTFDLDDPAMLFRADVLDDPAPFYAHLRARAPVWEVPGTRTFLVATAALVSEAVARPDDFSSNLRSLVYRGDDGCPVVFDMTQVGPGTHVLA